MEALDLLQPNCWQRIGHSQPLRVSIGLVAWVLLLGGSSLYAQPAQLASRATSPEAGPPLGPPDDGTDKIVATDLICVVGGDHVLAADVFTYIDNKIEENRDRIPRGQEELIRRQLIRRMLVQYVMIKAQYQDFLREIIGNAPPADAKEKRKQVETRANKLFFEQQVPKLLKQYEVTDLRALEEKLRAKSGSVSQLQQQFVEMVLASQSEERNVPRTPEVTRDELIDYYREHNDDWQRPGRARWRQLTARFDRYPNKPAARQAIEAMGNEIFLGGRPFEAVAKSSSQGYTAPAGGLHEWTTQGALKSVPLDAAIFAIAPNRLSQVIEDDVGYHIIEVLEREEARIVSFEEVQDKMRKAIIDGKRQKLSEEYRKKVMDRTKVWTLWPEDIPGSLSLKDALAD